MRFDLITVLGSAVIVAGCATQPVPMERAKPVPATQMLSSRWVEPNTDRTAKLVLRRDSGVLGSACALRVYIDGEA